MRNKVYHVGFDCVLVHSAPLSLCPSRNLLHFVHGCAGRPGSVTADVASTVRSFLKGLFVCPLFSHPPPPHKIFGRYQPPLYQQQWGPDPVWLLVAPRLTRAILTASRAIANSFLLVDLREKKQRRTTRYSPPGSDPTASLLTFTPKVITLASVGWSQPPLYSRRCTTTSQINRRLGLLLKCRHALL